MLENLEKKKKTVLSCISWINRVVICIEDNFLGSQNSELQGKRNVKVVSLVFTKYMTLLILYKDKEPSGASY